MNLAALKKDFGDEYPAAVIIENGLRLPLRRERRFSRYYYSDEHKSGAEISRFMDGTAAITAAELKQEWPDWSEDMRLDFTESSTWLRSQTDFPEMLRFVMQHGEPIHWSGVAQSIASVFSRDEAFTTLLHALQDTGIEHTANLIQAIAETKHSDAEATLRTHLATLWAHPELWDPNDFMNWVAADATNCIAYLVELGASPSDFTDQVRQLSEHVCPSNRDFCRNHLSKYYSFFK